LTVRKVKRIAAQAVELVFKACEVLVFIPMATSWGIE